MLNSFMYGSNNVHSQHFRKYEWARFLNGIPCLLGCILILGIGSLQHHETAKKHKGFAEERAAPVMSMRERKAVIEASFCYYGVISGLSYNSLDGLAQTFRGLLPFIFPGSSDELQSLFTTSFGRSKATRIINKILYDAAFEEVSLILCHLIIRLAARFKSP